MDIDQLFSIIQEEKSYTEETISEVKSLIEKFPYFQTGHMLLLKALHVNQPEKFNDQLNISGSFIPDKVRLFQFINKQKDTIRTEQIKAEAKDTKESLEKSENKKEEKEQKNTISKNPVTLAKEKTVKDIKPLIKTKSSVEKKDDLAKKEIEFEVAPVKKEAQVKIKEIKKTETKKVVQSTEINVLENSKKRHKKIVKDFFVDPSKDITIIDETTDEALIPRKNEIKKESKQAGKLVDARKPFFEKKIKQAEKEKTIIKEKPAIVEEIATKTSVKEKKNVVNEKPVDIERKELKREGRKEKIRIVDPKSLVKENVPVEKKRLLSDERENIVKKEQKGERKQSDVMNDIFSKIRAIKKEMNITSDEKKETIEVNSNINKRKRNRIVEPEDKKEETNEKSSVETLRKEPVVEKKEIVQKEKLAKDADKIEQIKKSVVVAEKKEEKVEEKETAENTITAKDLFKQHQKKKYEQKEDKPIEHKKSKIEALFDTPPVNKTKKNAKETEKGIEEAKVSLKDVTENLKVKEELVVEKETVEKEEAKIEVTKPKTIQKAKKESAADALLRRIALKKQKKEKAEREADLGKKQEDEQKTIVEPEKEIEKVVENVEEKKGIPEKREKIEAQADKAKTEATKPVTEKNDNTDDNPPKAKNLIDDFISKVDTLERLGKKEVSLKGDISKKSTEEKEEFMTEAMADLYIQQKYYDKAINIYNKLILKVPQKKTYFAIQIKKVESLIKNNK